jgi:hypothetical protein
VLPIIADALEGWKYNGWGMLPINKDAKGDGNTMDGECYPSTKMLKKMEIKWMGSALHRPNYINLKSCFADEECSPLPLSISTKKAVLYMMSASFVARPLIRVQHLVSFTPNL